MQAPTSGASKPADHNERRQNVKYATYEAIRTERGLKDRDVAIKAGLSPSTLSEWKNGKLTPNLDSTRKIAEALDVTIDELIREG